MEDVGYVEFGAGRSASGIATLLTALERHRRTGDRVGEAYCLSSIGGSYSMLHRYDEALRYLSLSTALSNGMGHARGEAVGQNLLGLVYQRLGRIDDAVACHDRAVALHASLGESQSMAVALTNLGWAHHRAGRHRAAIGYFERNLDTGRGACGTTTPRTCGASVRPSTPSAAGLTRASGGDRHWTSWPRSTPSRPMTWLCYGVRIRPTRRRSSREHLICSARIVRRATGGNRRRPTNPPT
ncbi:tetratricopeptide repeat protein [Virgisporangium aurantiacum]|uniref:tetratricopeptide repeat protein n=1 Tax=Virgisporangium aurantiacum TaxID=175570 RepID=UPI0023B2FE73|nr:tetratricopeptide repeat protein [Virgisporangium aurantiacum]